MLVSDSLTMAIKSLQARTGSSGLRCSEEANFRFHAAQRISLDFFKVSSILQARKSAAAAASCVRHDQQIVARELWGTDNVVILVVCMEKAELVVVDDGRVVGSDRPETSATVHL